MFKTRFKKHSKEELAEYKEKIKNTDFEKGDLTAIMIAALVTFVPTMLLVLSIMVFVIWLFFLRG